MLKNVSQKKIFTILEQKESSKLLEKKIIAFLWNILHLLNKKLQNRRIVIFKIKTVGCLAQINVHKCA
jgi:hypothetical protein